jgi:hypothetical protein
MSERSKLLTKVLQTWEYSDEGRGYLEWLIKSSAELDGGDLLREAVLDVMEDDNQLRRLRNEKLEKAVQEFCSEAQLPSATASTLSESTGALAAGFSRLAASTRGKAQTLRKLRRVLDRDRLETLEIVAKELRDRAPDEIEAFLKKFALAEELAAKVAALGRTSAEPIDPEEEWRKLGTDGPPFDQLLRSKHEAGEGWFDHISEELDRYFSRELVTRLEQIVERASTLDPVELKVTSTHVKNLFRQAHETYLYGFDVACIALCRSLTEQALKDRLSVPPNAYMKLLGKPGEDSLINRAESNKLLEERELISAKNVARSANDVMHNISYLRRTAQDVLDATRIVLSKLYGDPTDT